MGATNESRRETGVDVARALASLLMIQGHAFHGWASPAARGTGAYGFTRLLGTFPLPAFLVLAGAALVLRLRAARARHEDPARVRAALVRRGFVVLGWGYLLSLAYALLDGGLRPEVLLRADVLHVIGLSIALAAALGVTSRAPGAPGAPGRLGARGNEPHGRVDPRAFALRAAGVGLLFAVLCPPLSAWSASVTGPLRYPLGLLLDVPGSGLMPLIPLFGWLALGALVMAATGDRLSRPLVAAALLLGGLAVKVAAGALVAP